MIEPELQQYYDRRLQMFATPAWRDLMEDIASMYTQTLNKLKRVQPEELKFTQGELNIMEWFLGLEEISKSAYTQLQDAQNESND